MAKIKDAGRIGIRPIAFDTKKPVKYTFEVLKLSDPPSLWAQVLPMSLDHATLLQTAIERMVKTDKAQSEQVQNSRVTQIVRKLLNACSPFDAFAKCLAYAQKYEVFFANVEELIKFVQWIVRQVQQHELLVDELLSRLDERQPKTHVIKDVKFWSSVIRATEDTLAHCYRHLRCEPHADEFSPNKFVDAKFLITNLELMLEFGYPLPPCAFFRAVSKARECKIDLELFKKLVLAHHPDRIDDFYGLCEAQLLDSRICRELIANPELVRALSCENLGRVIQRWQEKNYSPSLLKFARTITSDLYPDGIPQQGQNKVWEEKRFSLMEFLGTKQQMLERANAVDFLYKPHGLCTGSYQPLDASILLTPAQTPGAMPITIMPAPGAAALEPEGTLEEIEEYTGPMEEVFAEAAKAAARPNDRTLSSRSVGRDVTEVAEAAQEAKGEESTLDEDVLDAWMHRAQDRFDCREAAILFISPDVQQENSESVPSAHRDMREALDLIAEDARQRTEQFSSHDQDLQKIVADVLRVQELLTAAMQGDATGLLESWTRWIDEIMWRLEIVNDRLKRPASVPEPIQEPATIAPVSVVTVQTELPELPVISPVTQESAKRTDTPALPKGVLGVLIQSIQSALEDFPAGAMKRQFTRNLEEVQQQIIQGVHRRTTQRKLEKLKTEISELLNVS